MKVTSRKPGPLGLNEPRSARETCLLGLLEALRALYGESSWLRNNSAAIRRSKAPGLELWLLLELRVLLLLELGVLRLELGILLKLGVCRLETSLHRVLEALLLALSPLRHRGR